MDPTHDGLARLVQRPLYGQAAAVYDGLLPRFDPQVVDCLLAACEHHLGHLPARTLDLGCGTGRYAVALAQTGLSVVGLDIQGDTPLVAVIGKPEEAFLRVRDIMVEGAPVPPRVSAGPFYFDDIGPHVTQDPAAEKSPLIAEVQHPQARQ